MQFDIRRRLNVKYTCNAGYRMCTNPHTSSADILSHQPLPRQSRLNTRRTSHAINIQYDIDAMRNFIGYLLQRRIFCKKIVETAADMFSVHHSLLNFFLRLIAVFSRLLEKAEIFNKAVQRRHVQPKIVYLACSRFVSSDIHYFICSDKA
jgi:hypothetical protein